MHRLLTRIGEYWQKPGNAIRFTFLSMSLGLLIAAIVAAPLTWDGAYYLLQMINTGEPFVAQGRIADKYLHYPVIWALDLTDAQSVTSLTFSLIHVVTPLVALLLSWWVVRRDHRYLMIWPTLTVGMALLPGQINFISEGIKAEQLMWPLLLSVLIGAPWRTIPVIAGLSFAIYFLHPVAAPILAAVGLASLVIALLRPADRLRLLTIGIVTLATAINRYIDISSGYEQSEMAWETQQRQWQNGVGGWPTVTVICFVFLAATLLCQPWLSGKYARRLVVIQTVTIGISTVALAIWAMQPSQWWNSLEFRGPAVWISLFAAGCAFLNVVIQTVFQQEKPEFHSLPIAAIAAGFTLVIVTQSLAWNGVVQGLNEHLSANEHACTVREDLPGYPHTPLNLWSTNAMSLLNQGMQPTKISMTTAECHEAKQTGKVAIESRDYASAAQRFDLSTLQANLMEGSVCSWHHSEGWHQPEALIPDTWRWTGGTAEIVVTMANPGIVVLSGEFRTLSAPNTVQVTVDGLEIDSFTISSLDSEPWQMIPLQLPEGTTTISFHSDNVGSKLPNDERSLAISLWNPVVRPGDGSSPCLQENAP